MRIRTDLTGWPGSAGARRDRSSTVGGRIADSQRRTTVHRMDDGLRSPSESRMSDNRTDLNHKKILFVRLSSLGDVILTLPTLKAIKDRYPHASIAWLVQRSLQDVLTGNPYLDEIIPVDLLSVTDKYSTPRTWTQGAARLLSNLIQARRIFQERQFDIVFEFQALFKSAIFAFLNRGAERYGFKNGKELSRIFLNRPIFVRDKSRHAVQNYLDFARYFGCPTEAVEFPIHVPKQDQDYVDGILSEKGIKPGDLTVFISATARWQSKFWEPEYFAQLGDEMVPRYGAKLIFSGLPSEGDYLRTITDMMQQHAIIMAGRTNIKQFFALMKRCRLFVGVDGGAMHAAAAFGIPVIALFGPTITQWVGPFGQQNGIITRSVSCAPCNKKRCNDKRCMREITPDVVLEKVAQVITSM